MVWRILQKRLKVKGWFKTTKLSSAQFLNSGRQVSYPGKYYSCCNEANIIIKAFATVVSKQSQTT